MRVLMVTDSLEDGGAERQLSLLANSLPEPWSVSVLSVADGPYRLVLEKLGIDVTVTPRKYRVDATPAFGMWRIASGVHPDIVHSWGWMSNAAMIPFCRARKIPLLNGTIRSGFLRPRRAMLERLGLLLSDAVVANSRAGLAAHGIAESDRAHVVYNGFDSSRLGAAVAAIENTAQAEVTVVVMTGRMHPAKDWRMFVQSARVLEHEQPGWKFVAVGDGPERDALLLEAADLVDARMIEFPECGLEVLPIIRDAHIGILLTNPAIHAEGCSNSILEYMACGLPVVCTDSGGNPELVEDGVTGFLLPPQDITAITSALRTLREDPTRAREMGREGRRRLEERFTTDAMVAGFVTLYESLLARHGKVHS
ncbi:MAG: glycosyltransferase [Actinomycetia bacterium]|nr:glycosyltransferase [Actinomycetes bacterium]